MFSKLSELLRRRPRRLVNSSVIEATDIIEKLVMREDKSLKLSLFSLQKFIKVRDIMV
jgi:hypothetical protein